MPGGRGRGDVIAVPLLFYLLIWMIVTWMYSHCETLPRGTFTICELFCMCVILA